MENRFGERIAKMRKEKGMTQEDVAEKIGISPQAVSKWENDTTLPDALMLKQLADLYGVSLNQIYGIQESPSVSMKDAKDVNKLVLRIIVDTTGGDKVRVNLPFALIKIALKTGLNLPDFNGSDALKGIDWNQIISLVEQGLVGNLVDVDTSNGDKVHIVVE